jgi:formylglycine-generating enzyme required for sulfatase activity
MNWRNTSRWFGWRTTALSLGVVCCLVRAGTTSDEATPGQGNRGIARQYPIASLNESPTHEWIAYQAYERFKGQLAPEIGEYLKDPQRDWWQPYTDYRDCKVTAAGMKPETGGWILEGAEEEDLYNPFGGDGYTQGTFMGPYCLNSPQGYVIFNNHFWNPDLDGYKTGLNFFGQAYCALHKALRYWRDYCLPHYRAGRKAEAYYYLGRIVHLLSDMSVPTHVHNDKHSAQVGGEDPYESAFQEYYHRDGLSFFQDALQPKLAGCVMADYASLPKRCGLPVNDANSEQYLADLFYNLAQQAQHFDSRDVDGNSVGAIGDDGKSVYGLAADAGKRRRCAALSRLNPISGNCDTRPILGLALYRSGAKVEWSGYDYNTAPCYIFLDDNAVNVLKASPQNYLLAEFRVFGGTAAERYASSDVYYVDDEWPDWKIEEVMNAMLPRVVGYVGALYQLFWDATHAPQTSGLRVSQRRGTMFVDVYYDLSSADSSKVTVGLEFSADGGATYTIPVKTVSGDVGLVAPGSNKHIVWNAGVDWPRQVTTRCRARLTVQQAAASAPSGMALISAGNFTMGDTFGEGWSDERPTHTVYVSGFYVDRTEVTKALWDEVYQWAVSRPTALRYSFDNTGSGKAANHPVHTVSWYDVVKWCNARSEKEGRVPAYYTSAAQSTVYRTGQVKVQNEWVKWSSGYRLPTEAEWEKAARGEASGRRFPWIDTDTIQHARANYDSSSSYSYDTSSTRDFHPSFKVGGYPYTSPVGYFAPNGYGLYDMAGNVWEWCWDWYGGYASGSQNDPRGPSEGSNRVFRGGGWYRIAWYCRVSYRFINWPVDWFNYGFGFRSVLPPGQ